MFRLIHQTSIRRLVASTRMRCSERTVISSLSFPKSTRTSSHFDFDFDVSGKQHSSIHNTTTIHRRYLQTRGSGTMVEGEVVEKRDPLSSSKDYDNLEKKLQEAVKHHQALRDNAGTDTNELVSSLEHVRDLYEKLQWWDDALSTQEALLDDDEFSPTRKQQSDGYGRIGRYYLQQGNLSKAQKYSQRSLEMLNDVYPKNMFHADFGRALNDLATIVVRKDPHDALPYLDQAEDHYRFHGVLSSQVSGDVMKRLQPHPELVKILENEALILRMLNNHESALQKYKEALDVVGKNDEEKKIQLRVSIGDCYQSMEETGLAYEEYMQVIEQMELDPDREETSLEGILRHNVGLILSTQGRHQDALESLNTACQIKRRVAKQERGNDSHPEVAKSLNGLGAVHAALGNTNESLSYFRESLLIARIHADPDLGDNDPNVMYVLRNIALVSGDKPPAFLQ